MFALYPAVKAVELEKYCFTSSRLNNLFPSKLLVTVGYCWWHGNEDGMVLLTS